MINIEAINGKGELYFNNKLYNFEEKNNKISLILNPDVNENIEFKLKNEENTTSFIDEYKIPELIFYVEYFYRSANINLNKINLEDISEISYKNPIFPLYLYSEMEQFEQDITIFFDFNKISLKNENYILKRNKNMNISSFIIEKKNILEHINNKQNYLAKFEAIIDPSIGIGHIYIPKEKINEYNRDYTFFLSIENQGGDKNIIYKEINIKSYIIKEESIIPIFENVYYYGKINDIKKTYKYKLKLNPKDYTYIHFSRNSKMVNFNISILIMKKEI